VWVMSGCKFTKNPIVPKNKRDITKRNRKPKDWGQENTIVSKKLWENTIPCIELRNPVGKKKVGG